MNRRHLKNIKKRIRVKKYQILKRILNSGLSTSTWSMVMLIALMVGCNHSEYDYATYEEGKVVDSLEEYFNQRLTSSYIYREIESANTYSLAELIEILKLKSNDLHHRRILPEIAVMFPTKSDTLLHLIKLLDNLEESENRLLPIVRFKESSQNTEKPSSFKDYCYITIPYDTAIYQILITRTLDNQTISKEILSPSPDHRYTTPIPSHLRKDSVYGIVAYLSKKENGDLVSLSITASK